MEYTQTKSALGGRPRGQLDALQAFALSVKPDVKRKSLVETLEELPDVELKQLERYASMIIKTASPYSGSYYKQAKRMYPAKGETKHLLLAAILQEIEPRKNTVGPYEERIIKLKVRTGYINETLKSVQKSQNNLVLL